MTAEYSYSIDINFEGSDPRHGNEVIWELMVE